MISLVIGHQLGRSIGIWLGMGALGSWVIVNVRSHINANSGIPRKSVWVHGLNDFVEEQDLYRLDSWYSMYWWIVQIRIDSD